MLPYMLSVLPSGGELKVVSFPPHGGRCLTMQCALV